MHTNTPKNELTVQSESVEPPSPLDRYEQFVHSVLEELSITGWELSILLTGDATIRDLNARYRRRDEVTDVLTFVASEGEHVPQIPDERFRYAGDIVIDLEQVRRQALDLGIEYEEELRRMTIHALLHLNGEEHASNDFAAEPMLRRQEAIMRQYKERLF